MEAGTPNPGCRTFSPYQIGVIVIVVISSYRFVEFLGVVGLFSSYRFGLPAPLGGMFGLRS